MLSSYLRISRVGILALAFLVLGCENGADQIVEPKLQVEQQQAGLLGDDDATLDSTLEFLERSESLLVEQTEILLVEDPDVEYVLELLGHTLTIPAGAVEKPTYFVMIVLPGAQVQVELYALDAETGVSVGENGFKTAVNLALSYADLPGDFDPNSLVIVHIPKDGEPEPLQTELNTEAQTVSADLDHFSRYALCRN